MLGNQRLSTLSYSMFKSLLSLILLVFICQTVDGQYVASKTYKNGIDFNEGEFIKRICAFDEKIFYQSLRNTVYYDGYDMHEIDIPISQRFLTKNSATGTLYKIENAPPYYYNGVDFIKFSDPKNNVEFNATYSNKKGFYYRSQDSIFKLYPLTDEIKFNHKIHPKLLATVGKDSIKFYSEWDPGMEALGLFNGKLSIINTKTNKLSLFNRKADGVVNVPNRNKYMLNWLKLLIQNGYPYNYGYQDLDKNFYFLNDFQKKSYPLRYRLRENWYPIIGNQYLIALESDPLTRYNLNLRYFKGGEDGIDASFFTVTEDADGKIWLGSYINGWNIWDGKTIEKSDPNYKILPGCSVYNENLYFFSDKPRGLYKKEISSSKGQNQLISDVLRGYMIKPLKSGKIALATMKNGLGLLDPITEEIDFIKENRGQSLTRILGLEEDNHGRIWSIQRGISIYDPKLNIAATWKDNLPSSNNTIVGRTLELDHKNTMWIGTSTGLKYIDLAGDFIFSDDLMSNIKSLDLKLPITENITSLLQVEDYLVIGGQSGVFFLDLSSFYKNRDSPIIYQLFYGDELPGSNSEQYAFIFDHKRNLWMLNTEGVVVMDWYNFIFDKSLNKINLQYILNGKDSLEVTEKSIILKKDNRNLNIKYGTDRNPYYLRNVLYKHSLISEENDTIENSGYSFDRTADIPYIPPGNYDFHLEAWKNGQLMDQITIPICAPYEISERRAFWALLGALFIGGIFGFILYRRRNINMLLQKDIKLKEQQAEMNNLHLQALISSFNPHFINNSLHWAQSRYSKDEDLVLLTDKLSRNLEYILIKTRATEPVHTFAQEMELTENYIEIQKIRFKDSFQYIPPTQAMMKKYSSIELPLMQIQIHVENAIEHGINNRLDSTYVKVTISENDDNYIIIIEDDGVGRPMAKKIKSSGTQNGTKMLRDLHNILNQNEIVISQFYEDNIYGNYGTRVIIHISKKFHYVH